MQQLILSIALIILISFACACSKDGNDSSSQFQPPATADSSTTPVPVDQSPDDIVHVPGLGYEYKANVHESGVENPWLPIETTTLPLKETADAPQVTYRDNIETKAGEIRHNIFRVYLPTVDPSDSSLPPITLSLETTGLTAGITAMQDDVYHGADPARQCKTILDLTIPSNTTQGKYNFDIHIRINGSDCGTVPCIINVI